MKLMSENQKIDIALTSASLNGAGTGAYFSMSKYGKALFVVEVGAMSAAVTSALQVMQAQDAAGTGAKVITNNAATITANTNVASAILTSALVHVAGDVYTVNGLDFTAAAADVPGTRTYAIGADATASTANLAAKINSATVGVPGVTASAAVGVLTLTATEPGETAITLAASAGAVGVPSTARAIAYVECDASFLDLINGFDHVALRVTNSAATQTGAVLLRGQARFSPIQKVAAAKTNVNV
ncbi:hypothetical protein JCM15765_14780 [Paradesulfitobacterium aromaticivorans]